jgi:hypothetical protein
MAAATVQYLVFDIESVADPDLVARLRYPREAISPADAVRRYRDELMKKYESDFIPYTFQIPIAVAVAKVTADFHLTDLVLLDEPQFRPHVIVENFWRGWEKYRRPTLVSFNGRSFDIPLLELAAFRYGVSAPGWFQAGGKAFDQPRGRYNVQSHLDLCELLTNFGSTRFTGGLNLAANLLGKPGKMDAWPRSTTIAAATSWTRTSSSCGLGCSLANSRWKRSKPSSPRLSSGSRTMPNGSRPTPCT